MISAVLAAFPENSLSSGNLQPQAYVLPLSKPKNLKKETFPFQIVPHKF